MNEFFSQIFSLTSLLSLGVGLIFVGVIVWTLPLRFKQTLVMREASAARLRAAGDVDRAAKIESDNQRFTVRAPVYGRVLVAIGIMMMVTGVFRLL